MDLFFFLFDEAPTLRQTLLAAFTEAWKEGAGQWRDEFVTYSCEMINYGKFVGTIFHTEGQQTQKPFFRLKRACSFQDQQ